MRFSEDEVDAALCLWEECILRMQIAKDDARREGGNPIDAMEEEPYWNFLRGGEGAANARNMCILLSPDAEACWQIANSEFGFDDSFDWEFIPLWVDEVMELTTYQDLNSKWWTYLAYKVTERWRRETGA